jgi:outer membrane immunogenic protein
VDIAERQRKQLHASCRNGCILRCGSEWLWVLSGKRTEAQKDLATVRGRAGFLVNNALWYATGGAAWATVKDTYQFSGSANPIIFPGVLQPGPFLPGGADFSTRRSGWTLGGGVEARLWGDWSAKLEYLYVDLGSVTEAFPIAINPIFGPAFSTGGVTSATTTTYVRDNIVRVGLNYKFGNSPLF